MTDLTVFICVSEILGSVHLYRIAPMVIGLAAVGLAGSWVATRSTWGRRGGCAVLPQVPPPSAPRVANLVALVAVSVVIAEWSTKTVANYHHGISSTDSLWYHMPFAARFVQDGSITSLHYVDSGPVTVFFPATSELFHSFGILLMGNDVLSPLLNTLWLGVALLASWCIGRPFGVAPVTMTGSAILFATPGIIGTQPGGAYDDVVGLALLLSSVALLINSRDLIERSAPVAWALAAASAGLALGTKWTLIGPVAALTVGFWFFAPRGKRIRSTGLWLIVLVVVGGFWYGRNFVAVGNPIPPFHLKLGPLSLPSPQLTTPSSTVAHYIFNTSDWRQFFLPGLRLSFGPAWWALLGLSAAGLVLAVIKGRDLERILGWVGLFSGLFFVFSPQYLSALGAPVFFVDNARYADPAVILGLVLLPINPVLSAWQRARWVLLAYSATLVATQFDSGIWPTNFFADRFEIPVRGSDFLIGLLVGVVVLVLGIVIFFYVSRTGHRVPVIVWVAVGVIVIVAGFPLQQGYLRDRYASAAGLPAYTWPKTHSNVRIGILGQFTYLQYPLYGTTDSNFVQYLGVPGPHGSYLMFHSCTEWRQTIVDGKYSYILIESNVFGTKSELSAGVPPEMRWMAAGRDSKIVLGAVSPAFNGYAKYALYQVGPHFSPKGCRGLP
jgi:hypothetical protein